MASIDDFAQQISLNIPADLLHIFALPTSGELETISPEQVALHNLAPINSVQPLHFTDQNAEQADSTSTANEPMDFVSSTIIYQPESDTEVLLY